MNLIEEKEGLIDTGKIFRNRTLIAQSQRLTINNWDLRKLKRFCTAKDPII